MDYNKRHQNAPEAQRKLAGGEASLRAQPPESIVQRDPPRQGRWNLDGRLIPSPLPGRERLLFRSGGSARGFASPPANFRGASGTDAVEVCCLSRSLLNQNPRLTREDELHWESGYGAILRRCYM